MKSFFFLFVIISIPFVYAENCNSDFNLETKVQNEKVLFFFSVNPLVKEFIIAYWIVDEKGNVLKKKIQTTNTKQKTYTPKKLPIIIKAEFSSFCNNPEGKKEYIEKRIETLEKINRISNTDPINQRNFIYETDTITENKAKNTVNITNKRTYSFSDNKNISDEEKQMIKQEMLQTDSFVKKNTNSELNYTEENIKNATIRKYTLLKQNKTVHLNQSILNTTDAYESRKKIIEKNLPYTLLFFFTILSGILFWKR